MHYLKEESYYRDLYDRFTIEECYDWETRLRQSAGKKKEPQEGFTEKLLVPLGLYFIKGERYRRRDETIQQWIDRDKERDRKVERAVEPRGIRCLGCSSTMECTDRDLQENLDNNSHVLFFFTCPECGKHRAYWEGGEEWEPRPVPCPKCTAHMDLTDSRKGDIITTVYTCPNCQYTETSKLDLKEKTANESVDSNFEADKKKYCLSDKEGLEYVQQSNLMRSIVEKMKDKKEHEAAYEMAAKVKKLAIADL